MFDYFLQSIAVANRSNDLICCENSVEPRNLFIQKNIIQVTEKAFDDFAGTGANEKLNRAILGID